MSRGLTSIHTLQPGILSDNDREAVLLTTPRHLRPLLHALTAYSFLILATLSVFFWDSFVFAMDDFSQGVAAANRRDFESAADFFSKAINKDPSFYAAYANRGSVLIRSGHILRGIEDWHKASQLAPAFALAVFTGDLIQHTTRKKTRLNFVLPTELDPELLASVVMTGAAYTDLGHPESAALLFRKSIDLTRNPLWKSYFEYWAKSLDDSP